MANLLDWLKKETQEAWGGLGNEINRAIGGAGNQVQGAANNIRNVVASQPRNIQRGIGQVGQGIQQQYNRTAIAQTPDILANTLRQIQEANDKRLTQLGDAVLSNAGVSKEQLVKDGVLPHIPTIIARSGPAMQGLRALGVQLPSANDALKTTGDITQGLLGDNPVTGWVGNNMVQPLLKGVTNQVDVASGQKAYTPGAQGYAELGNDAFNTASLAWAPLSAGKLAMGGQAAKAAIKGSLARGALAGGGSNALYQASEKGIGNIDPMEVLMSAGAGGVLNTAIPLAGGALKRTAGKAVAMEKARIAAGEMPGGYIAGPGAIDWKGVKGKFFGGDGVPRVEFDDSKAKLNFTDTAKKGLGAGQDVPLKEVFDHPVMYKQYSQVADLPVRMDTSLPGNTTGALAGDGSAILINPRTVTDEKKLKDTLLHESQHWIQNKEGMARGTSPGELAGIVPANANNTSRLIALQEKLDEAQMNLGNGTTQKQVDTLKKELNDAVRTSQVAMDKEVKNQSSNYLRSLAEVDARNVEIRQNMTPEQRANTPFYDTMDVPESEVFVQKQGSSAILRPVKEGVIDTAYKETVKNGGVTISIEGNQPSKGLAFAPYKGTEQIVDKTKFTPDDVGMFVNKNLEALNEKGNHLGLWEEDGKIYLDVSQVGDVSPATIKKAMDANQLAAFDLGTFDEVPLGKINKGVYNPLYEATNHPYVNKGQNTSSNTQGIDGKSGEIPEGPTQTPKSPTQDSYRVDNSDPQAALRAARNEIARQNELAAASGDITGELNAKDKYKALVKQISDSDTTVDNQIKSIKSIPEPNKAAFAQDFKQLKYGGDMSYYSGLDGLGGIKREDYIPRWDEPTVGRAKNLLGWYEDYPELLPTLGRDIKKKLNSILENVALTPKQQKLLAQSDQPSYRVEPPKTSPTKPGVPTPPNVPKSTDKTRGFTKNIFKNNFYEGNPTAKAVVEAMPKYKELPNRVTMGKAAAEINKDPSGALASIITKPQLTSATDVAKGNLLLRQAVESGDVPTAIELGTKLGVDGTKLGQAVQAFSTWKKTTPEGIVQYATKKAGLVDKQLDPKLASELIAMAKKIEKMPESLEKAKLKNSLLAKADNIAKTWKDKVSSVLATPRAAMATADLSAPLRQGGVLGTRFPKQASQAAVEQVKYMGSTKYYEKAMYEITQRPSYSKMKMAKLAVNAAEELTGTEEQFMSNILEGKAFKKIGIGHVVAGSDRAYTGFLTKLRADVFDKIVNDSEKAGIKLGSKELQSIAKFVNTASGRGSGKTIDKHAGLLSSVLFSPRLWKSRLDLLNPFYYGRLSPVARKYALQSSASFASVAGTVLGLATLAGATVVWDPRNADFAKIKVGNTRYDILGGLQQNIRLGAQLITGEKINSETGELQTLGPERGYGKPSRVDLLYQFFENKENPLLAYATKILRGTDQAGNPINPLTEGVKIATPLVAQGMYETAKDTGNVAQGIAMNVPALFGVGAQTYGQVATKDQGKSAKELIKEENGKVSTVIDGKTESFENRQKAEKAIDKNEFEKSGKDSEVIGDTYYYKSKDGEIRTKTKVNYEFDKVDSKVSLEMDRAKARDDLDGWLDYADKKYQAMEKKKQSYSSETEQDKIDDLTLKQENLLETAKKYVGYGGFTKGKTARGGSGSRGGSGGSGGSGSFITTGFKTAAQLKAPKVKGISVRKPTYKSSSKKLAVSKMPKVTGVKLA